MIGKYLSEASGNAWITAGYMMLPFVAGSLFGGVCACIGKWLRWLPSAASIGPIAIMVGVLSYTAIFAIDPIVADFSLRSVIRGMFLASFVVWPITFVMGPMFLIYMVRLVKGQKILKDSTVFCISLLCLISEFVFLALYFDES